MECPFHGALCKLPCGPVIQGVPERCHLGTLTLRQASRHSLGPGWNASVWGWLQMIAALAIGKARVTATRTITIKQLVRYQCNMCNTMFASQTISLRTSTASWAVSTSLVGRRVSLRLDMLETQALATNPFSPLTGMDSFHP